MKISKAANAIEPSLSRQLFNMAKNYDDVVDLTLGDPDIPPSEMIREAACQAVRAGKTRYSANAGLIQLREAIATSFRDEYGIATDPQKNVVVTVGGMEALFLSLSCLVDDGDEVIILGPYYVNYKQMIGMCGGVSVIVNTTEESGFSVTKEQIEQAVTDRTVAIIINTPCNPTGAVLSKQALQDIADVACKHDLTVLSDEVYRTLVYDGEHESIVKLPGMQERTVVIDSLSKRFAMTGYRLGYAIAPEELIANMVKMQENVAACASLPSQYAGIAAMTQCLKDTTVYDQFKERRDYIYEAISNIEGLSCRKPAATFYLFVNIEKTGLDSLTFAYKLLEKAHVAVVPGITYGTQYNNFIRIAYTMNKEKLQVAVERIRCFMDELMK